MQESIPVFHTQENSQLGYFRCEAPGHEFIDLRTLMLVRALVGPRACRERKLLFTQPTALCMGKEINVIPIGDPSAFRQLHTEGNYAVFVKTRRPFLPDLYVVGRLPSQTTRGFQPASAIAFFDSEASAIEALKRWALDPVAPKPPPKVNDPGAYRRNSSQKRKAEIEAGQLELDL